MVERPNQLWIADLTYVAIPGGFVYLAAILDAWSRKAIGYAISRSMDARFAIAALKAAIRLRQPPKGLHSPQRQKARNTRRTPTAPRFACRARPKRFDEPLREPL